MIKSAIKSIVYPTILYSVYDKFLTQRLRSKVKAEGKKTLIDFDYAKVKKSDTLFILGSGSSIMNLTKTEWEFVKRHDSIGFNSWVFHDFVPNYYALETSRNPVLYLATVGELNRKKEAYDTIPLFIQYQHMVMADVDYRELQLPKENVYYNIPYMPNTLSEKILNRYIKRWFSKDELNLNDIFHYSASLSYLLAFGVITGYKNIVLLGVDLNDSGYFFEHPTANEESKRYADVFHREIREKLQIKQTHLHSTASKDSTKKYGCLPIDVFIKDFKNVATDKGISIYVGSEKSLLSKQLPVYAF